MTQVHDRKRRIEAERLEHEEIGELPIPNLLRLFLRHPIAHSRAVDGNTRGPGTRLRMAIREYTWR